MADKSAIEWTDATWPIVQGCDPVSQGCVHCYAVPLLWRLMHNPDPRISAPLKGLVEQHTNAAGETILRFTGNLALREDRLDWPLTWKRPRHIFVPSHGDIFHKDVPDEFLDKIFAVMALAPQHTFQVLTKRSKRMRDYLGDPKVVRRVYEIACDIVLDRELQVVLIAPGTDQSQAPAGPRIYLDQWPLPNVWLGVSCEDQEHADERIPDLLATPAAVRFISAEPLLGPVDLTWIAEPDDARDGVIDALLGCNWIDGQGRGVAYRPSRRGHQDRQITREVVTVNASKLYWVIAGGESGNGARPMHPAWAQSLRDQCEAAGVAFFFKQWGAWVPTGGVDIYCHGTAKNERKFPNTEGISMLADGRICMRDFSVAEHARRMRQGIAASTRAIEVDHAALHDFHDARKNDDALGYQWMYRVGKKAAGRLLDGVEHNAMPGARS